MTWPYSGQLVLMGCLCVAAAGVPVHHGDPRVATTLDVSLLDATSLCVILSVMEVTSARYGSTWSEALVVFSEQRMGWVHADDISLVLT